MSSSRIVHIVPAVPPAFNGLSDYCYKLWQHWPQPRPDWTCLAPDVPPAATAAWPQATLLPFDLNKAGLLRALDQTQPDALVLHYVGYAYHSKGVPGWLPAALRAWKARNRAPLCVMFHELWARGTPRQSAFWLQPWMKSIARQLADLSESWITACESSVWEMTTHAGIDAARGHIVPIGSAIEPQAPIDWQRPWPLRERGGKIRLAIFGLPSSRMAVLRAHRRLLELLHAENLLESVALIGKAGDASSAHAETELRAQIAPAALWRDHHDLAPAELSAVLAEPHAALTHYSPGLLTKSSVYPAYCLHGLVTICQQDPLAAGRSLNGKIAHLGFNAPHIAGDDARAMDTVRQLRDPAFVARLMDSVRSAAHDQLSWSSITRAWQRALG